MSTPRTQIYNALSPFTNMIEDNDLLQEAIDEGEVFVEITKQDDLDEAVSAINAIDGLSAEISAIETHDAVNEILITVK